MFVGSNKWDVAQLAFQVDPQCFDPVSQWVSGRHTGQVVQKARVDPLIFRLVKTFLFIRARYLIGTSPTATQATFVYLVIANLDLLLQEVVVLLSRLFLVVKRLLAGVGLGNLSWRAWDTLPAPWLGLLLARTRLEIVKPLVLVNFLDSWHLLLYFWHIKVTSRLLWLYHNN